MVVTALSIALVIVLLYFTAPWAMRRLSGTITLKEWEYQRDMLQNVLIGLTCGLVLAEGMIYVYLDNKISVELRKEKTKQLIKEVLEEMQNADESEAKH